MVSVPLETCCNSLAIHYSLTSPKLGKHITTIILVATTYIVESFLSKQFGGRIVCTFANQIRKDCHVGRGSDRSLDPFRRTGFKLATLRTRTCAPCMRTGVVPVSCFLALCTYSQFYRGPCVCATTSRNHGGCTAGPLHWPS
jgi:hypothetical protein